MPEQKRKRQQKDNRMKGMTNAGGRRISSRQTLRMMASGEESGQSAMIPNTLAGSFNSEAIRTVAAPMDTSGRKMGVSEPKR